jgi:hypothetical protein
MMNMNRTTRNTAILGAIAGPVLALALAAFALASTHKAETIQTDCDTDSSCAALPQCALKPGCNGGPDSEPFRLVGYGCEGARPGQLFYADEEDLFPGKCARIEVISYSVAGVAQ